MKSNRPKVAVISAVCALPCAILTLWTLWLYFGFGRNRTVSEDLMQLCLETLWLSPVALASVVLSCFARGWRVQCLTLASIYFAGWLVVIIAEWSSYTPKPIIYEPQANRQG